MDLTSDSPQPKPASQAAGGWVPPDPNEMGKFLPGCEVLSLLGRGGMGAVYLALQTALDRSVAIKVLPIENSADEGFAQRFTREARAMARLKHPHIVPVYESGRTGAGHLYFVMEFIDGKDLQSMIHGHPADSSERNGIQRGLPAAQALEIASQVCDALGCAHAQGIVHRDIKPANIMVDLNGVAKVTDFGIARIVDPDIAAFNTTQTGTVVGTPDYIAPEQLRGEHVDVRADIYSVGVTLYEMLCGEVPRGVFTPPSRRIGCPPQIDRIVNKAMQQDPHLRHQTTAQLKAELDAVRASLQPPAPRSARRLFAGLTACAALATLVTLSWPKADNSANGARLPKAIPPTPAPTVHPDANRQFAEWVLSVGDSHSYLMAVFPDSEPTVRITRKEEIPTGPWEVHELWLDRSGVPAGTPPISEQDFVKHMSALTSLRKLFLRDIPVSDSAYAFLANNPELQEINLERQEAGDEVLADLATLKNIRVLNISTSQRLTGKGLEKLASLPVLELATFYRTRCGDDVAAVLATCPQLRQAHMEWNPISDIGLASLADARALKKVLLHGTAVTDAGVAALQQVLPECEIVR